MSRTFNATLYERFTLAQCMSSVQETLDVILGTAGPPIESSYWHRWDDVGDAPPVDEDPDELWLGPGEAGPWVVLRAGDATIDLTVSGLELGWARMEPVEMSVYPRKGFPVALVLAAAALAAVTRLGRGEFESGTAHGFSSRAVDPDSLVDALRYQGPPEDLLGICSRIVDHTDAYRHLLKG